MPRAIPHVTKPTPKPTAQPSTRPNRNARMIHQASSGLTTTEAQPHRNNDVVRVSGTDNAHRLCLHALSHYKFEATLLFLLNPERRSQTPPAAQTTGSTSTTTPTSLLLGISISLPPRLKPNAPSVSRSILMDAKSAMQPIVPPTAHTKRITPLSIKKILMC